MRFWVALTAWTLAPFGALGLVWSLIDFSLYGIAINAVLTAIGVHDIVQLRKIGQEPLRWRSLAITQALIGVIICGSLLWLRHGIEASEFWQNIRGEVFDKLMQVPGTTRSIANQAVDRSFAVLDWGLLIGGIIILLSQFWTAFKVWRLADKPQVPPLLPPQLPQ